MGTSKSKANKCGCRASESQNKDHCCLLQCFPQIKEYNKMEHLYWIIPITVQEPLYQALKYYKAEFITDIIIKYLPELNFKKSTIMPKKAKANHTYNYNTRNCTSCHVFIHANISWIYNKTKPPCAIWYNNRTFKAVIMGRCGVGKSSLILRHINRVTECISDRYRKQLIVNPDKKYLDFNGGYNSSKHKSQSVFMDYLDCKSKMFFVHLGSEEEYSAQLNYWIRTGEMFFVCFSITSARSFEKAKSLKQKIYSTKEYMRNQNRKKEYDPYAPYDNKAKHNAQTFAFILVATKCDLINERQVTTQQALELANEWRVPYFETSAKEDVNVNFMFRQSVYEYWVQNQTQNRKKIEL